MTELASKVKICAIITMLYACHVRSPEFLGVSSTYSLAEACKQYLREIGPKEQSLFAGPGSATDVKSVKNSSYFHANAYLRLDIPQVPGASSIHRQRRAAELWVCHHA